MLLIRCKKKQKNVWILALSKIINNILTFCRSFYFVNERVNKITFYDGMLYSEKLTRKNTLIRC